jgi:glycosyltransferase involved in cell wall biosynthesis
MADAAICAAGMGVETWFITVEPVKKFISAGDRERMYDLLDKNTSGVRLVSAKVNFTFEFGTEAYRAAVFSALVRSNVPQGVPVIVSDDMAVWAAAAAIADKYPMIGVLHGDDDVYYKLANKYYAQMSACACVSNRIKNTVTSRYRNMGNDKVYTIPCGIYLPRFTPSVNESKLIRLAFIGRITDHQKRAGDLVLICALLHKRGIDFHLDIAGNSESSEKDFAAKFDEAGVRGFVTFHGWLQQQDVRSLLNQSDVLLLTSDFEGMPLVMMEAFAAGCSFVGTRVSGIEDYEGAPAGADCMAVYTVGDMEDAVTKIIKVASVPKQRRQLAARKMAETEFGMQRCLDKYFSAIAAITPPPPAARPILLSHFDVLKSKALALARYAKMSLRPNKH